MGRLKSLSSLLGIEPLKFVHLVKGFPFFLRDYLELKRQAKRAQQSFHFGKFYPCINDRFKKSGVASGHYFHQDLLVASRIFVNNPEKHVDIGSRIDGFVAHVASFRKIYVFDIRPIEDNIPNIEFEQVDLMSSAFPLKDYCDSVSSLHTMEHFGLGRYGEGIDYYGHIRGLDNIYKMLKEGGKFYFSVPIGEQRIEFNAHRVFSVKYLFKLFEGKYRIDSFSYVNDEGHLVKDAPMDPHNIESNYSCNFGCGIFELTKITRT